MSKYSKKSKRNDIVPIGFGFLVPGILLATIVRGNRIIQIIGIAMILISVAIFSTHIRRQKNNN